MELTNLVAFRAEIATRMQRESDAASDPLALLADLNQALGDIVDEYKQRAGSWNDGEFESIQGIVSQALVDAESAAIEAARTNDALRKDLRDYFCLEGVERLRPGQDSLRSDRATWRCPISRAGVASCGRHDS